MSRTARTFLAAAAALLLQASCGRLGTDVPEVAFPGEVVFRAGGPAFVTDMGTRASAVTASGLSSFTVAALADPAGPIAWTASFSRDGDVFRGGVYWPLADPGYGFCASNAPVSEGPGGPAVAADASVDVVCAWLPAPEVTYRGVNVLAFRHVFARVGEVEVRPAAGYSLSGVSVTLVPRTGGVYSITEGAGADDGTGWSSVTYGDPVELASPSGGVSVNDLYLVPGEYELSASWTAARGDWSGSCSGRTRTVSLVGGKVNRIVATMGGDAEGIALDVEVAGWGENDIPADFGD